MEKTCRLRAFNRTPSPLSEMYLEKKESEMFSRFSQNLAEVKKESKREAGHLDKSNSQRSVDRSQSLFYFVSQDSHSQAGSTRSQCTAQTQCMIRPTCTTGWEDAAKIKEDSSLESSSLTTLATGSCSVKRELTNDTSRSHPRQKPKKETSLVAHSISLGL